jgi:pre-mRNA-splicing factor SPF27
MEVEDEAPLIDALAYIDPYTPEMEAEVFRLIEAEMQTFVPPNYLAHLAPVTFSFVRTFSQLLTFQSSPLMQREWERMLEEERQGKVPVGIPPLNVTRYSAPPPAERTDASAWQKAMENAQAQLEHQQNRFDHSF